MTCHFTYYIGFLFSFAKFCEKLISQQWKFYIQRYPNYISVLLTSVVFWLAFYVVSATCISTKSCVLKKCGEDIKTRRINVHDKCTYIKACVTEMVGVFVTDIISLVYNTGIFDMVPTLHSYLLATYCLEDNLILNGRFDTKKKQ
jgi:uncharacterized protein YqhQ